MRFCDTSCLRYGEIKITRMMSVKMRIEMPTSPVRRSSNTRPMKSAWKTGVKSQASKLNGSAPGAAGTSGG